MLRSLQKIDSGLEIEDINLLDSICLHISSGNKSHSPELQTVSTNQVSIKVRFIFFFIYAHTYNF